MTTPTPETPDGLIVGFDVSAGRDETALVFAKRLPNGAMEIVASLRGEAAEYVESLRKRLAEAEKERATLDAALVVLLANWDNGGFLDPEKFWDDCWPTVERFIPLNHRSFVWAVKQQQRDRAALAHDKARGAGPVKLEGREVEP